nr:immunoglobulin heavy chain junction region [Mus musculus]
CTRSGYYGSSLYYFDYW